MATSQDFVNWVCGPALEPEFLKHLLVAEGKDLLRFASGSVHQTIYFPEAKAFHICIPERSEQQRIVAILDKALEGIATAKANAETNLQSALELFARYRDTVFADGRTSWPIKPLGEIAEVQSGGTPLVSNKAFWSGDIPWYSSGELNNTITSDSERRITEAGLASSNAKLFPKGALLIGMYDTAALKMSILDREGAFNQAIAGVRPNEHFAAEFLLHAINVDKPLILSRRRGVRQKNLSLGKIKEITIPLPSAAMQHNVIVRLRILQAHADNLRNVYRNKLAALDELKRSLLHRAFSGQLTSSKQLGIAQQPSHQTTTPEFSAHVISFAHARHERLKREKTFGHVKEQKVLHLVEAIAGVDLGRRPMRDAAGPNDFQHMLRAEEWAKAHGFFDMVKRGEGYEFMKLSAFDEHMSRARQALEPYLSQVQPIIDLLVPMGTEEAEVFATVHAAWNNLVIDGMPATDDAIVSAAREGWHPDKVKIPEQKFRVAIEMIRRKELVPDGSAKYVGGQQSLL